MFADTLAWAIAQPAGSRALALANAYTSGTRRVTFDGRTVEYATMAELERALATLHASTLTAKMRRPARTVAVIGDGF